MLTFEKDKQFNCKKKCRLNDSRSGKTGSSQIALKSPIPPHVRLSGATAEQAEADKKAKLIQFIRMLNESCFEFHILLKSLPTHPRAPSPGAQRGAGAQCILLSVRGQAHYWVSLLALTALEDLRVRICIAGCSGNPWALCHPYHGGSGVTATAPSCSSLPFSFITLQSVTQ